MTMIQPPSDPPGQQRSAQARGPRPNSVEISFWLWITYLTIGAINTVVGFVQRDRNRADAINAVIDQYPAMDRSMIDSVATIVVVGVVVLGLLFVAAGVSFALLMRARRNWARVVLTVVGSLSVLFLIGPVVTPLQALFQLLLLVGAIVMMFQRPANDWFRPRRPAL
ncbi:MAG TPA: hypothetical protein VN748_21275 [Pseudonocardiaceae bacterium]|jgi:hypothetical protein|nr:hypothetical protein [Pseudonocardiaceae bacterium]